MRGIALNELAYLIIAIILVFILLVIFFVFQFPFMVFPIVLFDHLSTFIRGFVIAGIWTAFWAFVALFSAIIWISMANPECWGPQAVGCAAKNAIITAIIISTLTYLAFSFTSQIPLVYKSIQLQENNVTIDKNLGNWILDASYMANSGNNDPFSGTSTNPKIAFIITIKKGSVNLYDALQRLNSPTYSIYDKISKKVWDDELVMKNKWWHVDNFNIDFIITNSSGVWNVTVKNGSNTCYFGSDPSWKLKVENGEIEPQENSFKCQSKTYKMFVSKSELNTDRIHVTIGKYSLKYYKLKNLRVRIKDNSGWHTYNVVYNQLSWGSTQVPSPLEGEFTLTALVNEKEFDINGLKNVKLKSGTTIYIDYLDTCGFCHYYADECGGDLPSIEGVYVCIPKKSG